MVWGMVALAGLLLPFGASVIVWTAVRRTLRPLDRVAAEASGIDAEHLSHRFDVGHLPEELRPVCARLNESLARLEEAFARERRFTSAVAHELRTPLAELRSATEVALRWREDADLSRRGLETGLDVAVQMERLVTSLLNITRHEAGRLAIEAEALNVASSVQETWRPFAERAQERDLRVRFDVPSDTTVSTDRTLLQGILVNLASNAAEHTPKGGEIAWRAETDEAGVVITVTNTATDLRPEDIPHLTEPFWRRDAARTNGQHSGLGLTLAASFAEALDGSLDFTLLDPPALQAKMTLPGTA
jgi:two-component system sensor histidine kinase QseC